MARHDSEGEFDDGMIHGFDLILRYHLNVKALMAVVVYLYLNFRTVCI